MDHRTSLVIQRLRFHLPMQGHRFSLWSRKIPHGTGQISPCTTATVVSTTKGSAVESPRATITEPTSHNY